MKTFLRAKGTFFQTLKKDRKFLDLSCSKIDYFVPFSHFKPSCKEFLSLEICPASLFDISMSDQSFDRCFLEPFFDVHHAAIRIKCDPLGYDQTWGLYPFIGDPSQRNVRVTEVFEAYLPDLMSIYQSIFKVFVPLTTFGFFFNHLLNLNSSDQNPCKKVFFKIASIAISSLATVAHIFSSLPFKAGILIEDQEKYLQCVSKKVSCFSQQLTSDPEQIIQAVAYVEKVQEASQKLQEDLQSHKDYLQLGRFGILDRNCLDFMAEVIQAAGHKDWEETFIENRNSAYGEWMTSSTRHTFFLKKRVLNSFKNNEEP